MPGPLDNRMYVHHGAPAPSGLRVVLDHATVGHRDHCGHVTRSAHVHDVFHAVLFTAGSGSFLFAGEVVPFVAPYLVLSAPGQPHAFAGAAGERSVYSEATFTAVDRNGALMRSAWPELLRARFGCPCPVTAHGPVEPAAAAAIAAAIEELVVTGFAGAPLAEAMVGAALDQLLIVTFRHLVAERAAPPADPVERARALLEARLEQAIGLDELARAVGLSAKHLARAFKRRYGEPPVRWRRRAAMARAATMVRSTRLPLERIAERLGFDDPAYFSRVFRQVHGESPAGFRRRHLRGGGSDT